MSKKKFVSGFAVKLLVVAACLAASFPVSGQQAAEPKADKTVTPVAVNAPVAAATSKAPATLTTNDDDRYRIGPGDILDIRILNRPTLSRDAVALRKWFDSHAVIDEEIKRPARPKAIGEGNRRDTQFIVNAGGCLLRIITRAFGGHWCGKRAESIRVATAHSSA